MSNYWQRRNEELKHIQSQFQTDADYNRELRRIYDSGQREIQKEVDSFLQNYAGRENLSMDEAIKKVDKMDVEAFRDKAKRYVEEKDFSPRANDELRAFNVKMRMNRHQLLNEHIRLETVAMANSEERLLTARLDEEVYKEMQRQAGILGMTVPSPERIRAFSKVIVAADFKGTNFSNRIWANQSELQAELENVMRRTIIRGENPRVAARQLKGLVNDGVGSAKYKAERIAITESGRIQISTQIESFKEFGIEQLEVIVEPDGCSICQEHDGEIVNVADAVQGDNVPIFHPNCRCSTSSYVDRDAWDADLRSRGL